MNESDCIRCRARDAAQGRRGVVHRRRDEKREAAVAAIYRAVESFHGSRAAEAVGHFLREGLPGPSAFPLSPRVAAIACGHCGRPWGEHALPDLAACGSLALPPEEREGLELAA